MPASELFRQRNPLAALLHASNCVFRLRLPTGVTPARSLLDECERIGALLTSEPMDEATHVLTLTVSHSVLDAFGGMFLLSQRGPIASAHADPGPAFMSLGRRLGDCQYFHFVDQKRRGATAAPPTTDAPKRTLTQRILGRLMRLPVFAARRVAMAVAKDDVRALTQDTYLGNSLVLVELDAADLLRASSAPREVWQRTLAEHSERVKKLALRRPGLLRASEAAVTISSVGDVERIPWASALDPSFFEMIPTPSQGSATLVLWGKGDRQALTLCAREEHAIIRARHDIRRIWQECLGEQNE
jgi:hypothetical protein